MVIQMTIEILYSKESESSEDYENQFNLSFLSCLIDEKMSEIGVIPGQHLGLDGRMILDIFIEDIIKNRFKNLEFSYGLEKDEKGKEQGYMIVLMNTTGDKNYLKFNVPKHYVGGDKND